MFRAVALDKQTFPLQGMRVNPKVARRLPFDLACRYQALPVAEDDGHLTVAMAHPDDMEARQAILAALPPTSPRRSETRRLPEQPPCGTGPQETCGTGPQGACGTRSEPKADGRGASVYLVRGDPVVIDSLLADAWPGRARRALRLLVVDAVRNRAGSHDYARALGRLLGAETSYITCDSIASESRQGPPRRLLLVVQNDNDAADSAALACAVRLARLSGATVTVLAVVPPGPENGLATLLATENTTVGQAAQQLVRAGIGATLRLRQGSLDQQLHREVVETDYDLVVVGSGAIPGKMGVPNSVRAAAGPATSRKEIDHACGV